jgi:predicted permease
MGSADLGFRPDGITVARITLPENRYRDAGARWRFYESLERQTAALPGVASAAVTSALPPASGGMDTLEIAGQSFDPKRAPHDVTTEFISRDYFQTMGTPVLRGGFTSPTSGDRAPETLINEAAAAEYFPAGHGIGSRIRVGGEREPWLTVAGVVATERRSTVYNEMQWVAQPAVYRLADQKPPMAASIVARTRGEVPLGAELRRIAASIDPGAALGRVETMRRSLGTYLSYPRFRALVFGGFALFALLLAAVGLHGVLTELVTQRTQEIGIRMALGAKAVDIARLVARDGAAPVLGGLAMGIACASLVGSALSGMLYGVGARNLATLAGVSGALLAVAALALALPARRAARVDPMEALKEIG